MSRDTIPGTPPRRDARLVAATRTATTLLALAAALAAGPASSASPAPAAQQVPAARAGSTAPAAPAASSSPAVPGSPARLSVDPRTGALLAWAEAIFPWGAGEMAVEELPSPRLRGYRLLRVAKKYPAEPRMNDQAYLVLEDGGKIALVGDAIVDEARLKAPQPIRGDADLAGAREQVKKYLRGPFRIVLDPASDRLPTFRGIKILADTGYGNYEIGGYVSADDGALLFLGRAWDRKRSIPEQRRGMIKLANTPYSGPADATVTVVEYSDMQCPFCKKRTGDWEPLLEKLGKELKIRRYFKAFPLVNDHPWAMRASSAGLCFFQRDPSLFLRWKSSVYGRQEQLTVADLDMFAVDFATANDLGNEEFRSCYLQQKTTQQIHASLTEGFALRVRSTPSYFIDGVLVSWFTDGIMEDFLRRTYLGGKPAPPAKPVAKK